MLSRKKAFTLIELLVVIVIIGILAALIIVNVGRARKKARAADLQSAAKSVVTACQAFLNENSAPAGGITQVNLVPTYVSSLSNYGLGAAVTVNTDGSVDFTMTRNSTNCTVSVDDNSVGQVTGSDCQT